MYLLPGNILPLLSGNIRTSLILKQLPEMGLTFPNQLYLTLALNNFERVGNKYNSETVTRPRDGRGEAAKVTFDQHY